VAGVPGGVKERLLITACTVEKDGSVTLGNTEFEVMLNPSSYNHQRVISYNHESTFGEIGKEVKFAAFGGEEVRLDFVIDGTGVVSPSSGGSSYDDVKTQIRSLSAVVYDYVGIDHEPSVVRLLWGTLIFFGRLKTMSVEYTLFKPTGEPLRAKVKLAFNGFMSKKKQALVANRSSSDLSHSVEVREGDTLPLLCYRIYRDSSRYMEVARFNGISAFRKLEAGARISFPPLVPGTAREASPSGIRKYPPPPASRRPGPRSDPVSP
jgi:Contractile injection system tube protein